MLDADKESLLYQIFIDVDDFIKVLDAFERECRLSSGPVRPGPKRAMFER